MTRMPLGELWDDGGPVNATRGADLDAAGVSAALRRGSCGVVASIGERLRWLHGVELFDWWKSEARPRLLDPATQRVRVEDPVPAGAEPPAHAWRLEAMPGARAWQVSEWHLDGGAKALLFEEHH